MSETPKSKNFNGSNLRYATDRAVERIVEKWLRFDEYYKPLCHRSRRRKVLDAIEEVWKAVGNLFPLLEVDGRFEKEERRVYEPPLDVPAPETLMRLAHWIKYLAPNGKHPALGPLACARELELVYRMNTGNPNWNEIGNTIIKAFFKRDRIPKSIKSGGTTPGEWIRKRLADYDIWWAEFKKRTDVKTCESYDKRIWRAYRGELSEEEVSQDKNQDRAFKLWHIQHAMRLEAKKRAPKPTPPRPPRRRSARSSRSIKAK